MRLIVACGLKREAELIAKAGGELRIVAGGGDAARLERELDAAAEGFSGAILSSGLAGALDPRLKAGEVVIDGDEVLVASLRHALPKAAVGGITGSDAIAATVADKRALRDKTGAVAVDMESHIARRVAQRHGLPFAALRVISDAADETLPPAARVGMRPDGGVALGAVLGSLALNPTQLPALIRTGRHAGLAFRGLESAWRAWAPQARFEA